MIASDGFSPTFKLLPTQHGEGAYVSSQARACECGRGPSTACARVRAMADSTPASAVYIQRLLPLPSGPLVAERMCPPSLDARSTLPMTELVAAAPPRA